MENRPQRREEIEEIFQHIKKIRQEQNIDSTNNDLDPLDIIKNQTGKIGGELSEEKISPEDIFEIVGPVVETQE